MRESRGVGTTLIAAAHSFLRGVALRLLFRNRNLTDRRNRTCAALKSREEKFVQHIDVIGFDDEKERMLCVCAISANQLNSRHIGVEEGIRTPLIEWTRLWRMNLGDMKQHEISFAI
jgi:hypothetical protein